MGDLRNVDPAGAPRKSSGQRGLQSGLSERVGSRSSHGQGQGEGSGRPPVGGASGLEVEVSVAVLAAEYFLCSVNKQEETLPQATCFLVRRHG